VYKKEDTSFILHRDSDEKHINKLHMLIRRDILEGYIVFGDAPSSIECHSNKRRNGRMRRYANTIGFRCKFCKHVNPEQRAKRDSVYPRTMKSIYISCIRFQRDHIL